MSEVYRSNSTYSSHHGSELQKSSAVVSIMILKQAVMAKRPHETL